MTQKSAYFSRRFGVAALDHRRIDEDAEQARVKLLALAGALADVELRCRAVDTGRARVPLLRVWDGRRQHLGETVACLLLPEGWRFTSHPSGPVLADADGIAEPADARSAARVVAAHIARAQRGR